MVRKRDRELSVLGDTALPAGFVGIALLKSGIEIDGENRWRGDEIAVPQMQARHLVENNAAVFLEEPTTATAKAGGAGSAEGAPQ
jgi:hypothetical protein